MTPDPITAAFDARITAAREALRAAELARAEHLRDVVARELRGVALVADPQDGYGRPLAVHKRTGIALQRWYTGKPKIPGEWLWCAWWPDANDGDGSEGTGPTIPAALDALAAQGAAAVAVLRGEVTTMSDLLTAHLNAHATAGNCVWPSGMPVDTYGDKLRPFMNRDRPLPPGWTVDALNPMTPGALLLMLEDLHPGAAVWVEAEPNGVAFVWTVILCAVGVHRVLGAGDTRTDALTAAILAVPL